MTGWDFLLFAVWIAGVFFNAKVCIQYDMVRAGIVKHHLSRNMSLNWTALACMAWPVVVVVGGVSSIVGYIINLGRK